MFKIIDGDLLDATEDYICHQTNCTSNGAAAGLAHALFERFPWANCYNDREKVSEPGTIELREDSASSTCGKNRKVVNMNGQYKPGGMVLNCIGPGKSLIVDQYDSPEKRIGHFRNCLIAMSRQLPKDSSYAFPWLIGCGIAGGDWGLYITMLKNFESYVRGDVTLYKLPS